MTLIHLPTFTYEYDVNNYEGETYSYVVSLEPNYKPVLDDGYSVTRDGITVDAQLEEPIFPEEEEVLVERDTRHDAAMSGLKNLADGKEFQMRSARKGEEEVHNDLVLHGVEAELKPPILYGSGSKKDVDLLIANPRYGYVISDVPWYKPPQWLGGDVKLISKGYKSEFYTWSNGFVIDDVDDMPYEFLKSVYNYTPLTFWFKRSANTGKTIAVAANKFHQFTTGYVKGLLCYRYRTDKPVFLEDLSRKLVTYRDTHKVEHFNITEFKMAVATSMQEGNYADVMNTLTKRASYLTRDLMTYVVAEVDDSRRYDFLHSLDLPRTHESQRVTNDEDILEMFGLD